MFFIRSILRSSTVNFRLSAELGGTATEFCTNSILHETVLTTKHKNNFLLKDKAPV